MSSEQAVSEMREGVSEIIREFSDFRSGVLGAGMNIEDLHNAIIDGLGCIEEAILGVLVKLINAQEEPDHGK